MISKQLLMLIVVIALSLLVLAGWDLVGSLMGVNSDFNYQVVEIESELFAPGVEDLFTQDNTNSVPPLQQDGAIPVDPQETTNIQPPL